MLIQYQIHIQVHGYLRYIVPEQFVREDAYLALDSPVTTYSLLRDVLLIENFEATVIVNGRIEGLQYITRDGDEVLINSLISGG